MTHLAWWPFIVLAGAGVGICTGLFGVGGSSVATPVLALLGAPGLIAIASPLPATIPSAAVGAIPYVRSREARPHAAAWSVLGGIPGTVAGALLSHMVGGPVLLIISGLVLIAVGLRVILPIDEAALEKGAERRRHRAQLVATMALTGVFTGLLANGGGFLIVPLYLLIFGLTMRQAVGTSLLVITALAIPTLITHWLLGHINWTLAAEFALGQVPGSAAGSQFAHRWHHYREQRGGGSPATAWPDIPCRAGKQSWSGSACIRRSVWASAGVRSRRRLPIVGCSERRVSRRGRSIGSPLRRPLAAGSAIMNQCRHDALSGRWPAR